MLPTALILPSWAIVIVLFASFFVLGKTADTLVRALTNLGNIFKVSAFFLSFVLLGLTTSLPEVLVGVYSVSDQIPGLSLGNLIGGIIILLTLVVGLSGLFFKGIAIDGKFAKYSMCRFLPKVPGCHRLAIHDLGIIGALLMSPALVLLDGRLTRVDGVVLVILYILFVWYYFREPQNNHIEEGAEAKPTLLYNIALFLISATILAMAARIIVDGSEVLMLRFNIPSFFFGVIALALGTNLPEITIMLRARKYGPDVSVGNMLGSAAANVLLIGFLGLVVPLKNAGSVDVRITLFMLIGTVILLVAFFRTRERLSRLEAFILVLLYVVFMVFQSFLSR